MSVANVDVDPSQDELRRELAELREQQVATRAILAAISHSPSQEQLVLDRIAETAMRLCESDRATIFRQGADGFRPVAMFGSVSEKMRDDYKTWTITPDRSSIAGRVALDRRTVHVLDV